MSWLIKMDAELLKQVLIQGVTFLVFFTIVKKFFYEKINEIIKKRREMIDTSMSDAKAANEKALQMEAQYKDQLSEIENERVEVLKKASADADVIKDKILQDARDQASALKEKAQKDIIAERKKSEEELKDSIIDISIDAAQKVIGKTLDKNEHLKLIDESIALFEEVRS